MSTVPAIICTLAGVTLIVAALRDVFDVLFNETGRAVLAHAVARRVWRLVHWLARRRHSALRVAGPLALVAVVVSWALLLIVGWTLVFLPHMPGSFNFASGVAAGHRLVDALYVSMVTLATVGFGDISPGAPLLRLLTPLEALLGFGLLTASISWLLSIYPVLSRRRSLAYETNLLVSAQEHLGESILELGDDGAEAILSELTSRLVAVERDMATFPIAYYFTETDERFSLPATMPALLDLAERATDASRSPRVRLRATMLHDAIDDFARTVRAFHRGPKGSTAELVESYGSDHFR